jgi:8-oxo-dGTP pyrophosphatase MutT (NUDIX family)
MSYTTIAQKIPFIGPIFSVQQHTIVRDDDFENPFYRDVVHHLDAVAVVAMDDGGNIALIQQYRHPLREYILELPAGLIDNPKEDAEATARRELIEETGFEATDMNHLCTIASSPGFTDERVHIYLATELRDVGRPDGVDEEADLTLHWKTLRWASTEIFLGGIISAHTVAGILAAKEWLE